MNDYFKDLGMIYENLDFESSYDNYNPQIEKVKAEANKLCADIEQYLKGTINYYQNNKEKFFNNPSDMNSFEALKGMFERLRPTLAQYSQFTKN
jgi:hypothetical protein